jgi:ferredoxin-type protein NapF
MPLRPCAADPVRSDNSNTRMAGLTRRQFLCGRFASGGAAPRSPSEPKASIGAGCLALNRVVCSACAERCEVRAIRLRPAPGAVPAPVLDAATCTGCGACVAVCPVAAISLAVPA